jgi:hypothetical protein
LFKVLSVSLFFLFGGDLKYSVILYLFVVVDINWLKAATCGDIIAPIPSKQIVMNVDSQGKVLRAAGTVMMIVA